MPREKQDEIHPYCRKETEISEIHTKVKRMEKVLFDGNGGEAFISSIPKLSQSVDMLNTKTIPDLQKGISGLLRFQSEEIGRDHGKEEIRRRTKWVIGTLITFCSLLLVAIGLILTTM